MVIWNRSYVALALVAALGTAVTILWPEVARTQTAPNEAELASVVTRVDALFAQTWAKKGLPTPAAADSILVSRRLALALTGAVPSLEEIRAIQSESEDTRINGYLERLLRDRRVADYTAERLARAYVGDEEGPFLVFRRRRFVYWLSDQLAANVPYDQMVRSMVAGTGLWTDRPETNFITGHDKDPVALTARTTRAFLGMRLDCAQCHDHPFAHWKQADFAGLAAHYAGIEQGVRGITDGAGKLQANGRMMMAEDAMADGTMSDEPRVPFAEGAWPNEGTRRQRLAKWITSPDNPAFGKAIVNRVWTMMVGKSLTHTGVDDIEGEERVAGVLQTLGDDFAAHGHDLRRLVRIIARTRAFRATSRGATSEATAVFNAFPITKLRPEQIAGSLVSISSLHAVDAEAHILSRFAKATNIDNFAERYGDVGEEELREQKGTLMQQLVLMNGQLVRERIEANLLSAAGRIARLSPDDETRVRVAFLMSYARDPSREELAHFVAGLAGKVGGARQRAVEDMLWAMVNATEFSWNH